MKNSKVALICAYIFIGIFSLSKGIALNEGVKIYYVLSILSLFPFFYKLINTRFDKKYLSFFIPISILSLIICFYTKRLTVPLTMMLIICAKDLKAVNIAKVIFYTRITSFAIMVLLSLCGAIPSNDILFKRGEAIINRHSFGYTHPNEVFINIFVIISSGLISLNTRKSKNILGGICAAICILFYALTQSRTGLICSELFIVFYLVVINFKRLDPVIKKLTPIMILIPFILTFLISLLYGKVGFVYYLDKLLTGRIEYNSNIIRNVPLSIFGNPMSNIRAYGFNFDNSFLKILYYYGLVMFIIYFIYLFYFSRKILYHGNYEILALLLVTLIYGITESYLDNAILNYSLLFTSAIVTKKELSLRE